MRIPKRIRYDAFFSATAELLFHMIYRTAIYVFKQKLQIIRSLYRRQQTIQQRNLLSAVLFFSLLRTHCTLDQ